jgi:hypothetical protein
MSAIGPVSANHQQRPAPPNDGKVLGHDFGPTYKKLLPYFNKDGFWDCPYDGIYFHKFALEWDESVDETACKAAFAFLCTVTPGLYLQIGALNVQHDETHQSGFHPTGTLNNNIWIALKQIHTNFCINEFNQQFGLLKAHVDELMKVKVTTSDKIWGFLLYKTTTR